MSEFIEIICDNDDTLRLDIFLSQKISFSRTQIKNLISKKNITVNNKFAKPSYKLKKSDRINITLPTPQIIEIKPEPIPLNILYEDNDIIVVNKPQGLSVHPGAGNASNTLVNAILYHCNITSSIGGRLRPGIVHRLDKDTSGVMVIAKNTLSHQNLSEQIKQKKFEKKYLALVVGDVKQDEGEINFPIGRDVSDRKKFKAYKNPKNIKVREALTYYNVVERYNNYTLLNIIPYTGRTHQIRVHLSSIGHSIVGDSVYGSKKTKEIFGIKLQGQLLHSSSLSFSHPVSKKYISFTAPLPPIMKDVIEKLRKHRLNFSFINYPVCF